MYLNHSHKNYNLLCELLAANKPVWETIEKSAELNLQGCHVGAGCIAQTVWNHFHGFEPWRNISDIDLVYFDNSDLSYEMENEVIELVQNTFKESPIPFDVKNQARVHLWYKDHFGYNIKPYGSIFDAIKTWPTTATSIAVNLSSGTLNIYAPFGLDDLFNLVVRANKVQITKENYELKVEKWTKNWSNLVVIPW